MNENPAAPNGRDEIPEGMFDDREQLEPRMPVPLDSPTWPYQPGRKFDKHGYLLVGPDEVWPNWDEIWLAGGVYLAPTAPIQPS